jgi:hypothetical protein
VIDCIDECPFLTHCPTCGSSRECDDDYEDESLPVDVEGYPLCTFCCDPIKPTQRRAFIEAEDTVLIVCEDCIYNGVAANELPHQLLEKIV